MKGVFQIDMDEFQWAVSLHEGSYARCKHIPKGRVHFYYRKSLDGVFRQKTVLFRYVERLDSVFAVEPLIINDTEI